MVRCHGEAFFGKHCRPDLPLAFDEDIEDPIANFADKMLMTLDQRIEMLRAPEHQNLQLF